MRDMAERAASLDAVRCAASGHPAARLEPQPAAAQFALRGGAHARERASAALALALPTMPCRSATAGNRAALWLGPDEWLVIAPLADECALEAEFAVAMAGIPHAWVNVGHRNAALVISGAAVTDILNAGCPLNLDVTAFPVGMCTRTILAKAGIILWRTGATEFTVSAGRSFIPYVWDFLVEVRARL
jgi:sarcosine oxidase, subunit gamma